MRENNVPSDNNESTDVASHSCTPCNSNQKYLHLYVGCDCRMEDSDGHIYGTETFTPTLFCALMNKHPIYKKVHLDLRPLSDMTYQELQECGNMVYDFSDDPELNNHKWQDFEIGLAPEQFHWLLSKHFDLFGLIEAGLAIDKTKQ
jgi:hypothetical protein